jgi:hypothetical protein
VVERIVHFEPSDFLIGGSAHFGFHDRTGRLLAIEHQRHFVGVVGSEPDRPEWTMAAHTVFEGVPNVFAELEFPMYADVLGDGALVVSCFGNACLYRVDEERMQAELLVDGRDLGLADMGNCVVDEEGFVWVNEVRGCRIWRFSPSGLPVLTLGDGSPGFQRETATFDAVKFSWVYDLRRGPERTIYVLDSGNFAVRVVDVDAGTVSTLAGTGFPGYTGDGGDAQAATFGSDPDARFDGPISLSLDESGNVFVGDRQNHVVRMIERETRTITTIAGDLDGPDNRNDVTERDPLQLHLPAISSMDYDRGRLFVPTDLTDDSGDLVVMRRS